MSSKRFLAAISIASAVFAFAFHASTPVAQPQPAPEAETAHAKKVDYQRDIQPIFGRACVSCHGPAMQMSAYRLDTKQPAFAGGTTGRAVVPGNAAASSLYMRVAGIGELARMPFGGKPLDASEIALIRAWIDEGAEWPDTTAVSSTEVKTHWAFVPPKRPRVPKVKLKSWPRNPIDHFTLARLEQESLSPSPQADRATLLRRLSLDLIGLPPKPEEVDAFLGDKSPNAYEKQVNRLLDSPHYGERWGRFWLDAARYADSNGFEKDTPRSVWFFRDWVINALNRDLPYDRFIIEQIAGDMLPGATQDQIVATGFLRNSMLNEEGGIDPEQFRMEAMFDRMDAVGKGILGITIQCAQCHNHKYDPLLQEEYYRMFAFLNDTNEGRVPVYTPQEEMKRSEIFRNTREIEAAIQHRNPDWQERMARWEEQAKQGQPEWTLVVPEIDAISTGGEKYLRLKDGSLLGQGYVPGDQRLKLTVRSDIQNITAFQLELLTDPNLPMGGPGSSVKGTCALSEFDIEVAPPDAPDKPVKAKIAKATADVAQPETPSGTDDDKSGKRKIAGGIEYAIDGKDETAWGIDVGPGVRNQSRKAVFAVESPISNVRGSVLTIYLTQRYSTPNKDGDVFNPNTNYNLGRFRLSLTTTAGVSADPLPKKVRDILSIPHDQRSPSQVQAVFGYWRTTVPEWKQENDEISALWREHPAGSSQLVMSARRDSRETHILTRGDFLKPGKAVEPGVPAFLHPLRKVASWKDGQPTRLTFAEWLADRNSPTTARSLVNRVWQSYFGIGIVSSSEDLGKQTDPPSHPELLDWLAVEFMDRGWSMKTLHRRIVTSATYRQSSRVTPELYQRDPYNRLLARGPRFRVDAEIVRDIVLDVSGLLSSKVGGPSVFPPAPEFLFKPPASFINKTWNESGSEARYRRAIYTFRYRSVPYPMLQAFDAPNGDFSCVRRGRSNTPLQALTTLNEPLFLESARALAARTLVTGGASDGQRLSYAFRRCLSRRPSPEEKAELLGLLKQATARYEEGKLDSWDLLGASAALSPLLPSGMTPAQLAGWTVVSRALLNLDETITKE